MSDSPLIAVVDDEPGVRAALSDLIAGQMWQFIAFSNGAEALEGLKGITPDLILLDVLMPRMDGLEFCRRYRELHPLIPILFLSSLEGDRDKVAGLEIGGDDYVTKPFSVSELLVRIRVCLRRAASFLEQKSHSYGDAGLVLDPGRWEAYYRGRSLVLTVTEFRIVQLFISSPGRVFTRDQLMEAAFPMDRYPSDRNTDAHIRRIRKKLREIDIDADPIKTVYGVGYRYEP